ncbi:sporulation histidine kinase inhibitor Sda [Bacillus salacetis]|uniref:Sporulation histidine kinase inhibitor Sda n=1 Tax=Bacillus salacetis TaxID=2315464 RepID=A0A3A1R3B4_9BACI|nr:sporulation histidine kinase inhibitor Sda [Bacillus salacetis]
MDPITLKQLSNKQLMTVWRHAKKQRHSEEYIAMLKKEMKRRVIVTYK